MPAPVDNLPSNREELVHSIERRVEVDARSLALFRVGLGSLILADLYLRLPNMEFLYSDSGAMPRSLSAELQHPLRSTVSAYHYVGSVEATALLFMFQALLALSLVAGYRTTLATALSFILVLSLDIRNPFVLSYGDTLMRLLLFWGLFLPLGERWSVDAVHRDRLPRESVAGVASALILLQMVYMYFTNGYLKLDSELWRTGDAAVVVLGQDEVTYLVGDIVREFPGLLQFGGFLWFTMLLASPLLVLLVDRKRAALAALFVGGHLSFLLTVRIGTFPLVAVAGLTLFLQPAVWRDVGRAYDGVVGGSWLEMRVSSAVDAATGVARRMPESSLAEDTVELRKRVRTAALVVVVAGVVVLLTFGVTPLDSDTGYPVENEVRGVADTFGLSQGYWSVFAGPETSDRYYVFPAETGDGEVFDVYGERSLSMERPFPELQRQYTTYRERFYMDNVRLAAEAGNPVPAGYLADYLCRSWRGDGGGELAYVNMIKISEEVTVDTVTSPEDRHRSASRFYAHGCGENEPKEIVGLG